MCIIPFFFKLVFYFLPAKKNRLQRQTEELGQHKRNMDDASEVAGSVTTYSTPSGSLNIKDVIKHRLRDLVEKPFETTPHDNADIKVYVHEPLLNCQLTCICSVQTNISSFINGLKRNTEFHSFSKVGSVTSFKNSSIAVGPYWQRLLTLPTLMLNPMTSSLAKRKLLWSFICSMWMENNNMKVKKSHERI